MPHPLHLVIADLLRDVVVEPAHLIVDDAGNGDQRIPLFSTDRGGREHRLCCVDALVKVNGHVRLLVEIEESNVKPTQLAGKYLTSALAKFFVHDREVGPIPKWERVWCLQIVSTKGLKPKSKKPAQWRVIEEAIRSVPILGSIHRYGLFAGKEPDFAPEGNLYSQVSDFVVEAINDIQPFPLPTVLSTVS